MTDDVCIDANILVNILVPDEGPNNENLLSHITSDNLVIYAPAIIGFEFANAIGRKTRLKHIKKTDQKLALEIFYELSLILYWKKELINLSTDIQKEGISSLYDASYLAVAFAKDIPLITNDKELLKKGSKIHDKVYSLYQWIKRI